MEIEGLIQIYEQSEVPFVYVDSNINVLYANQAAKFLFPGLSVPDGLILMLPTYAIDMLRARLREGKCVTSSDSSLYSSGQNLVFTPYAGGAIVHFTVPRNQSDFQSPEGIVRSTSAVSSEFRRTLSNNFAMLGVISQKLHLAGEYSLDQYINEMTKSSYEMLRVITNITEMFNYNGALHTDATCLDIWMLLVSALDSAATLTKAIGIPLTYDLPTEFTPVRCDQKRLLLALYNIISNCCRFTKEGNKIHVTGKLVGNSIMLSIRDSGLGIPAEYLGRVFEPYYSYDACGMPFAGLGVGLTVVKQVITSFGGSVTISSTELEGTTLTFTLPVAVSCEENQQVTESAADFLRDRFSSLYIGLCRECGPPLF